MSALALPYFLAEPAGDAPAPGVVLLHEGNGVTAQLLRLSQRLAAEGYVVLAPDLYFRLGGTEASDSGTLARSVGDDQLRGDLTTALELLRERGAEKIGITGFCMGGSFSYRAALWGIGVECAAPFYGSAISRLLGSPKCPVLLFFGGRDAYIPRESIEKVQAHHGDDVVFYRDAGHGFMRDGSEDYREAAATDAWARLLNFLAANLR
jgi:carboxymethylenebutenolidase